MEPKIYYYESGQIESEIWISEAGEYHRLDGPVKRRWYRNWINEDDDRHRLDGPARRWWFENGQLRCEEWCINGKTHRLDGPAGRWWFENGQVQYEEWFINGVQYTTEAEFQVAVDLYRANEIAELF